MTRLIFGNRLICLLSLFVYFCIAPGIAAAQTCILPNNLVNGSTADATQVMANFNALLACLSTPRGYIAGLTMANDASNVVIDTAPGVATSDDQAISMSLASAFQKSAFAPWSSGSGTSAGCLDSGNLLVNQWYHLYVIARVDSTPAVDELCSTNATSPAMPPNYTKKRRIGSFKTAANSTNILGFIQDGDYFQWKAPASPPASPWDVSVNNPGTAAVLRVLNVPLGVSVIAQTVWSLENNSGTYAVELYVSDPGTTNLTPSPQLSQISYTASATNRAGDNSAELLVRTNTSAQVQTRIGSTNNATDTNVSLNAFARGWFDTRGRFN